MSNTTVETAFGRGIEVVVTKQHKGQGRASLLSPLNTSATLSGQGLVTIGYRPIATVGAAIKGQPAVTVGMVYTTAASEGLEMWWTDGWKALWDNGKRILWQTE